MEEYWKVIDNKWGDDCMCYDTLEEAVREAKYAQESNNRWNKENAFKVKVIHIFSEEVDY